jgi:hypothetical protein
MPLSVMRMILLCGIAAAFSQITMTAQVADPLDETLRPALAAPQGASSAAPVDATVPVVWVTDAMAKVQPNAPPGKDRAADLSAARNEFESFQVHLRAGNAPLQMNVTVSDFVNARTGKIIAADTSVAVFREAYLNVTTVSDLNGIAGRVPDALIPVRDAYFLQNRNAFPVTVPPNENRSAWIDVFVPPDAASGYYMATATVKNGGQTLSAIPVRLKVWNFTLPSTATLKSAFGMGYGALGNAAGAAALAKYPGAHGDPESAHARMHVLTATLFLDHRVSVSAVVLAPTVPNNFWNPFDSLYGLLLDGKAPSILSGARLTALQYPNAVRPSGNSTDLKDWAKHFTGKGWLSNLFTGACDEPPAGCSWSDLGAAANGVRSAAPNMPVLVTTNIAKATENGVLNSIDILTPVVDHMHPKGGQDQRSTYDEWLKLPGKQLWWYQSCDEHESCDNGKPGSTTSTWPSYMVDASPVRNRIFQWMAWLYRIQGELYYATEMWGDNPWDHLYFAGGNGDGALYYPGTVDRIGGTQPIAIASIRLKLIREGMEDYEYLFALSKAGHADLANKAARSFITNAFTFNDDPAALRMARETMGTQLHRLSLGLDSQ